MACAALAGGARAKAFFVRKDAKAHGLQRRIEGPLLGPDDRCVIVEDVVTTGGQVVLSVQDLRSEGAVIEHAVCVIDREGGGSDVFAAEGITLHALFSMRDLEAFGPGSAPA